MNNTKPKKILIVGDAGRGKSVLAEKISQKLDIKHYSTDDFYWKTKFTERRDEQESIEMVLEVYKKREWIVEGGTTKLFSHGLDSADLIIHLVYPTLLLQWWRLIKREIKRKNTNFKEFVILLRHIFYKKYNLGYKRGNATIKEVLEPYESKIVRLSSFKKIDNFVNSL